MNDFQIFLESSDIRNLVIAMISNRFERTPRLAAADWFDENNMPSMAQLLRFSEGVHSKKIKQASHKNHRDYGKIREEAVKELKDIGLSVFEGGYGYSRVETKKDKYRIGAAGVELMDNRHSYSQVDASSLPENVLIGIAFLIADVMFATRANGEDQKNKEEEFHLQIYYSQVVTDYIAIYNYRYQPNPIPVHLIENMETSVELFIGAIRSIKSSGIYNFANWEYLNQIYSYLQSADTPQHAEEQWEEMMSDFSDLILFFRRRVNEQ